MEESSTLLDISFCFNSDINLVMYKLNRAMGSKTEKGQTFLFYLKLTSNLTQSIHASRRHRFLGQTQWLSYSWLSRQHEFYVQDGFPCHQVPLGNAEQLRWKLHN